WGERDMRHGGRRFRTPWLPAAAVPSRREQYSKPKVIFAKMAESCEAFWDIDGLYGGLNVNCFTDPKDGLDLGYIAAYVNSAIFMFFYSQFFDALRMREGYFQFQSPQLRVIPTLKPSPAQQAALAALARRASKAQGTE